MPLDETESATRPRKVFFMLAERSQADDPLDAGRDSVGTVIEDGFRRFGDAADGNAEQAGPAEDTDVVARHQGVNRVVDDVLEERRQDFGNAFRCLIAGSRYVELQRQGEDETDHDGKESR